MEKKIDTVEMSITALKEISRRLLERVDQISVHLRLRGRLTMCRR